MAKRHNVIQNKKKKAAIRRKKKKQAEKRSTEETHECCYSDEYSNGDGVSSCSSDDDGDSLAELEFFQGGRGETLNGEYRVVAELGKGTFGRVVEAYEINPMHWKEILGIAGLTRGIFKSKTSGVYAIKVIRNKARYRKDAEIEARMLRLVNCSGERGQTLFPIIHDEFELLDSGHKCLVFEKLGFSLYEVLKKYDYVGFTLQSVKEIAIQLFDALDHLHSVCNIVHTDIKPENLLLAKNYYPIQIKLIDFGSAVFDNEYKSTIVNTRQYRAPEILLELGWSFPSDIWAAACTLGELVTGHLLMNAKDDKEHLALIEKKIGMYPRRMVKKSIKRKQFEFLSSEDESEYRDKYTPYHNDIKRATSYRVGEILPASSVDFIDESLTLKEALGSKAVKAGIYKLLDQCLSLNPKNRPKARKALKLAKSIDLTKIDDSDDDDDDEDEDGETNDEYTEYGGTTCCCNCIEC